VVWVKGSNDRECSLVNVADFGDAASDLVFCEVEVTTVDGVSRWFMPLGIVWEKGVSNGLASRLPILGVRRGHDVGVLTDGFLLPEFAQQVFAAITTGKAVSSKDGLIHFRSTPASDTHVLGADKAEIQWLSAEQSNSSLIIGGAAMLKIYRRISDGQHPEAEMNNYLTARGFAHAPAFLRRRGPQRRGRPPFNIGNYVAIRPQRRRRLELAPRPSYPCT
jgi:maltose alpha-D-glucosyltransferase / alpha-amylase